MTAAAGVSAVASAARGGRMLAWRLHGYGDGGPRLEAARVPALRAPDHILVRVHAASVNPLDVAMIDGYGSRILNTLRGAEACLATLGAGPAGGAGGAGSEFPLVLGRDFVGEVVDAGPAARTRVGSRVWGALPPHVAGAHAQYVVARESWTGAAPRALGAAAGGALYAALSAAAALRAAGAARRALLLGLGPVGAAALQLLHHQNVEVTVVCGAAYAGRAAARGAARVLDRRDPELQRAIRDAGPFDVVLECAGAGAAAARAAGAAGGAGRVVTLTSPLLQLTDARGLAAGLAGAAWRLARDNGPAPATAAPAPATRWAYFRPHAPTIDLLRRLADQGKFVVDVESVVPWWRADEAYRAAPPAPAAAAPAPAPRGKILIDFTAQPPPGWSAALPAHPAHPAETS